MRAATLALLNDPDTGSLWSIRRLGVSAPSPDGPGETVQAYISAIQQDDCNAVIGLLSSNFKGELGGDAATSQWCAVATQDAKINPSQEIQVLSPQPTGSGQATMPVVYTDVLAAVREMLVDTVMEGDSWKIQDIRPSR
jgi:hypothetical protein